MKKKSWLIVFLLVISTFFGGAFKFPELKFPEMNPYVKYRLSKLPLIGRWIEPPPPPEKEYQEAKRWMEKLEKSRADRYTPDLYQKIKRQWDQARQYYQEGRYHWAVYYFEKISQLSQEAVKKAQTLRQKKREEALKALKRLRTAYKRRKDKLSFEERVKLELVLWRLETLIELEEFDLFASEIEETQKKYQL